MFGPNSIHYLLSLWQCMVASVPYVKATEPHLLETYTHCASLGGQQDNYEKIIFQQISVLIYFFVWNPLYPLV